LNWSRSFARSRRCLSLLVLLSNPFTSLGRLRRSVTLASKIVRRCRPSCPNLNLDFARWALNCSNTVASQINSDALVNAVVSSEFPG
jgi:hypothetical protein